MKKSFIGISMITIMLICLTGCGNGSTLKCTATDGSENTITATLNGNKITKVVMEEKMVADSEEEAQMGVDMYTGLFSSEDDNGVVVSGKADGKNFTMTMTMDVTKMSEDDLESYLGTKDLTKDAFVEAMKEKKLTCE